MPPRYPLISDAVIFSDDAKLAAQVASVLSTSGTYLPVVDGPRMQRPDREAEVINRTNAAARSRARRIFLAGVTDESADALIQKLGKRRSFRIRSSDDLAAISTKRTKSNRPFVWGNDRVGIGLLLALRKERQISFEDRPSERMNLSPKSDHLVVCEEGEELRNIAGDIPIPSGGSITFITDGLPYGFAFPEVPSTHLFSYPNLGITTLHGFAAEQPGSRGVQVATLVNPETTPEPEIDAAANILSEQRLFVRVYQGPGADVTSVSEMIELFPYDLLIIATHCGDVSGYRWTYEFVDSENIPRKLVVDIALGIGTTRDDNDLLQVTQFIRFVSLDGVPWNDREQKAKLYVGKAIHDFMERTRNTDDPKLEPIIKDTVPRVVGSAAMRMHDNNFIALPRSLASDSTPIVINNACVSWHRLASNFMFGGARAYVGTLFPISTTEAEEVLLRSLRKHYGKMLPHALWSAQREIYGDNPRRPYVVAGIYTQRIRATADDVPAAIARELRKGLKKWIDYRDNRGPHDKQRKRTVDSHVKFFQRELGWFNREWSTEN